MTLVGFSGPAGTGKTWSLLHALGEQVTREPLSHGQRVLGLTFMHGSRRRLQAQLEASSLRGRFECQTFDRFAWEVVRRWRSRQEYDPPSELPGTASQYDITCAAAAHLLRLIDVTRWIARAFPIVLVDELQDCSIERLSIVQALAPAVRLFVAADEFQDLRSANENASIAWLRSQENVQELTKVHRTNRQGLVAAAVSIRSGSGPTNGVGFKIEAVPSTHVAASRIAFAIAANREVAVLSTSRPGKAKFVDEVVNLVSTKSYGPKKNVGPFTLRWEDTVDGVEHEAHRTLNLEADGDAQITAAQIIAHSDIRLAKSLRQWVDHQRRVCGRSSFASSELCEQIRHAAQQCRSFGHGFGRRVMTIQQAKNREFDHVVVLWPYQAASNVEMGRRLLYNAVTRARKNAIVLVQDPKRERVTKPPFA